MAHDLYSQAIDTNPKEAGYYGNRSAALLMLGEYRKALNDATVSIRLDEQFVKVRVGVSRGQMHHMISQVT